jgi:hypothetical protein
MRTTASPGWPASSRQATSRMTVVCGWQCLDARSVPYNGMLPCFFGGFVSRLLRSMAKAVISFRRVKRGSMISST